MTTPRDRMRMVVEQLQGEMSQSEIERRAGLSRGYLSQDRADPRGSTLRAFADATGVRLDWLLHGTLPQRAADPDEQDTPAMREFLERDGATLSEATIAGLRAFATKSGRPLTAVELRDVARGLEGQYRLLVLEGDPVEVAKRGSR